MKWNVFAIYVTGSGIATHMPSIESNLTIWQATQ